MERPAWSKIMIPAVALMAGLIAGLGISHIQITKEQTAFQEKIKEANKRIAFLQKKAVEERNEAAYSVEQRLRGDLDKLENEKQALAGQARTLKDQMEKTEKKLGEADESSARTRKELSEARAASDGIRREVQEMERKNRDLADELKRTAGEKQALQAELRKMSQDLDTSESNNAELCIIAEELLKEYKNKGFGTVLKHKEPLTQVKRVELEQFVQKYHERIDQQRVKKNHLGKDFGE
ncbi:MAG TPA: hypothetical protein VFG09_00075 [Thermodesulfovibrionales bacterium]|nr:hypothetical protein [Thermodesulfovibrionales bacterium]